MPDLEIPLPICPDEYEGEVVVENDRTRKDVWCTGPYWVRERSAITPVAFDKEQRIVTATVGHLQVDDTVQDNGYFGRTISYEGIDWNKPLKLTIMGGELGNTSHTDPPRTLVLHEPDQEGWRHVEEVLSDGQVVQFPDEGLLRLRGTVNFNCLGACLAHNEQVVMRHGAHVGFEINEEGDETIIQRTTRLLGVDYWD